MSFSRLFFFFFFYIPIGAFMSCLFLFFWGAYARMFLRYSLKRVHVVVDICSLAARPNLLGYLGKK